MDTNSINCNANPFIASKSDYILCAVDKTKISNYIIAVVIILVLLVIHYSTRQWISILLIILGSAVIYSMFTLYPSSVAEQSSIEYDYFHKLVDNLEKEGLTHTKAIDAALREWRKTSTVANSGSNSIFSNLISWASWTMMDGLIAI